MADSDGSSNQTVISRDQKNQLRELVVDSSQSTVVRMISTAVGTQLASLVPFWHLVLVCWLSTCCPVVLSPSVSMVCILLSRSCSRLVLLSLSSCLWWTLACSLVSRSLRVPVSVSLPVVCCARLALAWLLSPSSTSGRASSIARATTNCQSATASYLLTSSTTSFLGKDDYHHLTSLVVNYHCQLPLP